MLISSLVLLRLISCASANTDFDRMQFVQAQINSLPEKALTLDFVVTKAIHSSDSYKVIQAESLGVDAAKVQSKAALDGEAYAKANSYNSRNEPTNPFAPYRQMTKSVAIGGKKYFSSGTLTTAEISHGYTEFNIAGTIPFSSQFYQTIATAYVHQNLFKDAFGSATRSKVKAGEFQSASSLKNTELNKEEWFFQISRQFYGAWNAQVRTREAQNTVERRRRLLDMTRIRSRRGTVEKPDLIQAESALKQAELSLKAERQELQEYWHRLVNNLALPKEWLSFDPLIIPIKVDHPEVEANILCTNEEHEPKTIAIEKLSLDQKMLEHSVDSLKSAGRPETLLSLGVTANGIDRHSRPTYPETTSFDHPAYTVGLTFTMPLGNSEIEAQLIETNSQKKKLEAVKAQMQTDDKTAFKNLCMDLKRHQESISVLSQIKKEQTTRTQLEKERYELGRAQLLNVINSEDDLTNVEIQLNLLETSEKSIAWMLLKYNNKILASLKQKEQVVSP